MECHDEAYYLSPEYIQDNGMMRMLARLLSTADAEIGTNELEMSLFLVFVELESLVRGFGEARKAVGLSVGQPTNVNVRRQIAETFRSRAMARGGVSEHVSGFIDYLAKQSEF